MHIGYYKTIFKKMGNNTDIINGISVYILIGFSSKRVHFSVSN